MLSLKELVEAVNLAALGAADAVRIKNLEIIEDFFEPDDEPDPSKAAAIAALDAAAESMEPGQERDSVRQARERLVSGSLDGTSDTDMGSGTAMRPRMVAISYPKETSEGPGSHLVYVPLVTLTPMTTASLSNITFRTDLELSQTEDGDLEIAFPCTGSYSGEKREPGGGARGAAASLEISLDAAAPSQGLQKLIEGYERALRAQIPG